MVNYDFYDIYFPISDLGLICAKKMELLGTYYGCTDKFYLVKRKKCNFGGFRTPFPALECQSEGRTQPGRSDFRAS